MPESSPELLECECQELLRDAFLSRSSHDVSRGRPRTTSPAGFSTPSSRLGPQSRRRGRRREPRGLEHSNRLSMLRCAPCIARGKDVRSRGGVGDGWGAGSALLVERNEGEGFPRPGPCVASALGCYLSMVAAARGQRGGRDRLPECFGGRKQGGEYLSEEGSDGTVSLRARITLSAQRTNTEEEFAADTAAIAGRSSASALALSHLWLDDVSNKALGS